MIDESLQPLFAALAEKGASDLHWAEGAQPKMRIHGTLADVELPESLADASFAKLTARLVGKDNFETFLQRKEFDGAESLPGGRRIRINLYRKLDRIAWAIRLLPEKFFAFEELGLPVNLLESICKMKQGLVLVTGATGSGKTTTIASLIDRINRTRKEHIVTIEDPVEYVHRDASCLVSQREVGRDTESFHNALRAVLREDPDVVLLGEMRDRISMDAALTLAETGHLTFATLHTSGAADTVSRIVSAFDAMEQQEARERLAANLKVVITQQLVPLRDGTGRALAAEIMVATKAIQASIRDRKERQIPSLIELGAEHGMITMSASLARLKL